MVEDQAGRLGDGRFGEVFRGRHGEAGEACAVKRVRASPRTPTTIAGSLQKP
jgi:hypothetical protein